MIQLSRPPKTLFPVLNRAVPNKREPVSQYFQLRIALKVTRTAAREYRKKAQQEATSAMPGQAGGGAP